MEKPGAAMWVEEIVGMTQRQGSQRSFNYRVHIRDGAGHGGVQEGGFRDIHCCRCCTTVYYKLSLGQVSRKNRGEVIEDEAVPITKHKASGRAADALSLCFSFLK